MKVFCTFYLLFSSFNIIAQTADTANNALESVTVTAFEQSRQLRNIPAAIGYINRQGLERFSPSAIVHAVNTLPGIRMEERSPGSYRLNIRGSSLRSPFGVRNVKVYFNDIPLTDPSGQTYLNGLGSYNFNSLEIIKGPGSSLYGAGTGGVMLIESMDANEQANIFGEYSQGSFGLQNAFMSITTGFDASKNKIGFQRQGSGGYRYHSGLWRNVFSWNGRFGNAEKSLLKTTFLYSDLFYETPGALTLAEFENNPRLARPAGGGFLGSEAAQAAIKQKTFLAGISYRRKFTAAFTNSTSAYGSFTELRNPVIRNYGQNSEPHVGGRTSFAYQQKGAKLVAGGEFQQGFNIISVFQNRNGYPDSLQSLDDIPIRQGIVFLQGSFEKDSWEITMGGSLNFLAIRIKRSFPAPLAEQTRDINKEFSPRISLAKNWKTLTVYSSISGGFSPPTTAELLPSGSNINLSLSAERGTNYDVGARGRVGRLTFDINAFLFALRNTIVQRRDAGGGDFFVNAGKTKQYGIETALTYPLQSVAPFFRQSIFWLSHTFHSFRYQEFKQLASDFSGKRLPGVAPHTISTGIDIETKNGWLANASYYFSDRLPLNDANTQFASAYHLFHAKIGYEKWLAHNWQARLIVGVENLFDETYSLGNDINGFGGRYYNAAQGRSFYITLAMRLLTERKAKK